MKKLSNGIIFNVLGNVSVLFYSIILLPTILKMLGKDAVGIIGFYNIIFTSLMFFDFGFGVLANREISRTDFLKNKNIKTKNLVDTLEILYWIVSFIISFMIFVFSKEIAFTWIKDSIYNIEELSFFIKIISVSIFFRWPISFYFNVNSGMQNLVKINVSKIIIYIILTISLFIFIVGLKFNVGEYLIIITLANALLVISYSLLFRKKIGFNKKIVFKIKSLKGHVGYAAGSVIISSLTLLTIQLDKLFLSYHASLSSFGMYTIVFSLSIGIVQLIYPITGAFFPRLNELLGKGELKELKYNIGVVSSLLSVITSTFLVIFLSFKMEILNIWIGEHNELESQHIFSILIIASSLYAIAQIPYLVESAKGRVRFVMFYFLIVNVIYIMLLFYLKNKIGIIGVAYSYLITIVFYFLGAIYLSFKNFSKEIALSWMISILKNIIISVILIFLIVSMKINLETNFLILIQVFFTSLFVLLAFIFLNKNLKNYFLSRVKLFFVNVRRY